MQSIFSDEQEFNELFRAMYAPLVHYAFRFTGQKSTAADVVQDSFVQLWQNRHKIEIEHSLKAYLYRMVRNLALNFLRDNRFEQPGLETAVLESKPVEDNPEDAVDEQKKKFGLLKCWVSQLPDRQREAFELSRFEGLDHEEIAGVMEVSKRTVNNHIVDALRNIQKFHDLHYNTSGKNGNG